MTGPAALIGDLGGTNARFALLAPDAPAPRDERVLATREHSTPEGAIQAYLDAVGASAPPIACLAAAGPVVRGRIALTNVDWVLSGERLAGTFGFRAVQLLNDFEAVALALPHLSASERLVIAGPEPAPMNARDLCLAALGPGTGLGAAGFLRRDGVDHALVSEAGHMGFAPDGPRQQEVLRRLSARWPRVSAERLVSGPGIGNLYGALADPEPGGPVPEAAAIFEAGLQGSDPAARECVDLFFEILGQVAGDLVLALGAFDGLFLAGGIAQRHREALGRSAFRRAFERKGRHASLMARVPTCLVTHPQPGLLGAAARARALAG